MVYTPNHFIIHSADDTLIRYSPGKFPKITIDYLGHVPGLEGNSYLFTAKTFSAETINDLYAELEEAYETDRKSQKNAFTLEQIVEIAKKHIAGKQ